MRAYSIDLRERVAPNTSKRSTRSAPPTVQRSSGSRNSTSP